MEGNVARVRLFGWDSGLLTCKYGRLQSSWPSKSQSPGSVKGRTVIHKASMYEMIRPFCHYFISDPRAQLFCRSCAPYLAISEENTFSTYYPHC